ncbi:MAG: NAD(P)/FAD-dependent oxidoreductase [Clostridiales bacterium]|nr:NAD(P)/FAD-dependent oxidoreductase [Clostridiales bacterium]
MQYDYIIVGAGIGGLAAGNFLTKYGKKVLIVDKNERAGGQLTTFQREGFSFDSSIFHLNSMGEKEIINQILGFWGKKINCERVYYEYNVITKGRRVKINTANFKEDLIKAFPNDTDDINKYFVEVERLTVAIGQMKSMKPPFKMTTGEKVSFLIDVVTKRRLIMKYTRIDSIKNLRKFFKNEEIIKFIYSIYPVESLTGYYHMYGIGMPVYYPKGGMQTITNEIVDVFKNFGGELRLSTKVDKIIIEDGKAVGILTADKEKIMASTVISNVAPHYTFGKLVDRSLASPLLKNMIDNRRIFESFCFVYLGMDKSYQMNQNSYIIPTETVDFSIKNQDATPENCSISVIKYPCQEEGDDYSVILVGFIPYEYNNCWGTYGKKVHDAEYKKIKEEVKDKLINRAAKILGDDFKKSIKVQEIATPLSFERYTNVEKGGVMGWSNMGWKVSPKMTYIPYETPVKDLYLTGQFTFPSGGIPGVLSSGYYLACELLEKDNIDLYRAFREYRGLIK